MSRSGYIQADCRENVTASDSRVVDSLEAMDDLIARAKARLGVSTNQRLSIALGAYDSNMVGKWRGKLKGDRSRKGGPTFEAVLPLLEAAGVFSKAGGEAAALLQKDEALAVEIDRLDARARELEAQRKPRRQGREATGG